MICIQYNLFTLLLCTHVFSVAMVAMVTVAMVDVTEDNEFALNCTFLKYVYGLWVSDVSHLRSVH